MQIVWDEPKRLANLDKHGLDFAALALEFFAGATVLPARGDRFFAIGHLGGKPTTVVFARLGTGAVSIISMRSASPKERKLL